MFIIESNTSAFFFFFFWIGNRNFIEIEEHRIHDDEESNNSVRFDVQHHYLIPFILFFFFWLDNIGNLSRGEPFGLTSSQ